jgi:hypothetical protein
LPTLDQNWPYLKSEAFQTFQKERFCLGLEYDSFLEVVSTSWKEAAWGCPLYPNFSISKWKGLLKGDLPLWNQYLVGSIFSKIKEGESPISDMRHSEIRWKEKDRLKWLKEGDRKRPD